MYEILIFHGAGLIKSRNERKEEKKSKVDNWNKRNGNKKKKKIGRSEREGVE